MAFDRRSLLRYGAGGMLGALASRMLLRDAWADAPAAQAQLPVARRLVVLWMNGGPSHVDTWDPKTGPTGGKHKAIKTRIPNVTICEHLPRMAELADKLAIVRSLSSKEGNHQRAQYMLHTGYAPNPTVVHPSMGAWLTKHSPDPASGLPGFVSIGGPSYGAGFLGVQYGPFVLPKGGKGPENLGYAQDTNRARFEACTQLLAQMEDRFAKETGDAKVEGRRALYAKAVRLMHSDDASAFDLTQETEATRAAFGDTDFGRGCLSAVRLLEAGVKVVEVVLDGWDTHQDNFTRTQKLMETVDPAMSSLLGQLERRRAKGERDTLLQSTLVVWMGDFGRTPRINANDGRDHFPQASSVVLAGAGVRGGQVYGQTDAEGAKVVKDLVTVPNLMATLAAPLGLDPGETFMTPIGRPISITDKGEPIKALLKDPLRVASA